MPCGARLPSRAVRERDPETRNCFSEDATWQNRDELIFEGQSEDYAPKLAASYIRWTLRNYDDATLDGNQSVAFWFRANDPEGRQTLFEMGKTQGLAVELDGEDTFACADAGLSFSGFALEGAGGIGGVAGGGIVANGSDTFHGSMDDVRIYTGHALDLDQGRKLQQLRRVEF